MSIFSESLKSLLDENNKLFNRTEWAELLGVNEFKIQDWLNDKSIPRPSHLYMIWGVLQRSTDIPDEPLEKFKQMSVMKSEDVSPHGKDMFPNVWDYMTRPIFL